MEWLPRVQYQLRPERKDHAVLGAFVLNANDVTDVTPVALAMVARRARQIKRGRGFASLWEGQGHVERYANNPIEADHSQLKHRLRAMRGLRTDRTAQVIIAGHAVVQNLRRGHYELSEERPYCRCGPSRR